MGHQQLYESYLNCFDVPNLNKWGYVEDSKHDVSFVLDMFYTVSTCLAQGLVFIYFLYACASLGASWFLPVYSGSSSGGPPSPSLFILVEDVLSHALNAKVLMRDRFFTTLAMCPTYLMFADDIILFSCAKRRAILSFMTVSGDYIKSLWQQLMNHAKCNFFLPSNALEPQVRVVKAATNFNHEKSPFIYLGVLVDLGKRLV